MPVRLCSQLGSSVSSNFCSAKANLNLVQRKSRTWATSSVQAKRVPLASSDAVRFGPWRNLPPTRVDLYWVNIYLWVFIGFNKTSWLAALLHGWMQGVQIFLFCSSFWCYCWKRIKDVNVVHWLRDRGMWFPIFLFLRYDLVLIAEKARKRAFNRKFLMQYSFIKCCGRNSAI